MIAKFQGSFAQLAEKLFPEGFTSGNTVVCSNKDIGDWKRAPKTNSRFRPITPFGSYAEDAALVVIDASARVDNVAMLSDDASNEHVSLLVWYESDEEMQQAQEDVRKVVESIDNSHIEAVTSMITNWFIDDIAEHIAEALVGEQSGRLPDREVEHKSNGTLGLDGSLEHILGDLSSDERVQNILSNNFTCPISFCEGSELSHFTVLLCCLRAYDTQALNSWLQKDQKCPTCRANIDSLENLSIHVHRDGENVSKLGKVAQLLSASSERLLVVSSSRMPYIPLAKQYWRLTFVTTLDEAKEPEGDYSVVILSSHDQEKEKVAKYAPKAHKVHLVY